MIKLSDHNKLIVHDEYKLFEKGADDTYRLLTTGDYIKIQVFIENLKSDYLIERFTYYQYTPSRKKDEANGE